MDVKDYLKSYKEIERVIDQKLEALARLKSKAERATTTLSHMPKSTGVSLEDIIAQIDSIKDELKGELSELVERRKGIELLTSTVSRPLWCAVLRYKYISGYSFRRIAMLINYDERQVRRINGYALEELRKTFKDVR